MKKCTKCGSNNKDVNNYCSNCGSKLESVAFEQLKSPPSFTGFESHTNNYNIIFKRPNSFQMVVNAFRIKIDNSLTYDLKNNSEITVDLPYGQHSVEISVFSLPKKKKFTFDVNGDMTLICQPNPMASATLLASPVKIKDTTGREY